MELKVSTVSYSSVELTSNVGAKKKNNEKTVISRVGQEPLSIIRFSKLGFELAYYFGGSRLTGRARLRSGTSKSHVAR